MQVTGYQIRAALTRNELRRTSLEQKFRQSLFAFPGETRDNPESVMHAIVECEAKIALLQAMQAFYNVNVQVNEAIAGKSLSLAAAVKMIGGAGRVEGMWRDALGAKEDSRRRYYEEDPSKSRSKDKEYATPVMKPEDITAKAIEAASKTNRLRAAIAEANTRTLEVNGFDASLLE